MCEMRAVNQYTWKLMLLHIHQCEAVAVVTAAAVVVVIFNDSHEAKIVYNFQCEIYQTEIENYDIKMRNEWMEIMLILCIE